jgi:hypothetical protein
MSFEIGDVVHHIEDKQWLGVVTDLCPTVPLAGGPLICVHWDAKEDPTRWYSPTYLRKVEQSMSQAIWCDKGGHAFSAKDPDKEHYTSTRSVPNGNVVQQVTAELDICGPCTKDVVLFEAPQITAGTSVQDKVPGQVQ